MNRTLVILKPEVIERDITGEVLQYFDRSVSAGTGSGLKSTAMIQRRGSESDFRKHYKDVISRVGPEIGDQIVARMTRGDCIFIIYEGDNAQVRCRELVGATDPTKAAPNTIRRKYGMSVQYNVVHASDSVAAAEEEIGIWFPERSVCMESTYIQPHMQTSSYNTGC